MSLFTQKFDEPKRLRSIRLTDTAWNSLEKIAIEQGLTRTDLIEEWSREYQGKQISKHMFEQDREELRKQLEKHVNDILESKLTPKKTIKVSPYGVIKRCLEELVDRICSSN